MGKGRGGGRGKGGCECCETVHALACCLCLILFGGPILIAVGSTLIAAANRNERARTMEVVQAAISHWNDQNASNGWQQFQKLVIFANLTSANIDCSPLSLQLQPDWSTSDRYWDGDGRFNTTKQLRFSAIMDFSAFYRCHYNVNLTQQLATQNKEAMVYVPTMSTSTLDYSILINKAGGPNSCTSSNEGCYTTFTMSPCRQNCESYFGGQWSCAGSSYQCSVPQAYYNSLAVKVSYQKNGYFVDNTVPGPGGGGNVLPAGYERLYDDTTLPRGIPTGPLFQVPNVVRARFGEQPTQFTVMVRSAFDPWLSYMQATDGSGYFGATKSSLLATGVPIVLVGCLGTLFWLVAAFYVWWMLCSRHKPASRPSGVVSGYAWDLANRYGGQYAPAFGTPIHGTGPDGMPTAQPLYGPPGSYTGQQVQLGQPVHGYPQYSYPQPYGSAQPGSYPAYQYPQPYPPPGPSGNVEMSYFNNAQNPPYTYPPTPPQPAVGTLDAQGAPTGTPYTYPYAYQYPPYGGPQAVAVPPPPPPSGTMSTPSHNTAAAPPTTPLLGAQAASSTG